MRDKRVNREDREDSKMDEQQQMIRALVRGVYDSQKMRIQAGNRIVANFRSKMGQAPGQKEELTPAKEQKLLKRLKDEHARITDGVVRLPRTFDFPGVELISNYTELAFVDWYMSVLESEERQFRILQNIVDEHPLWIGFLKDVAGVGPAMAGVIISEIDIHKARHPSSLWRYAGLDVAEDGRGRGRYKEHLEQQEYVDTEGETQLKLGITYNPFLKTKLVGVLAGSLLKTVRWREVPESEFDKAPEPIRREKDGVFQVCSATPYAKQYYQYKHRLQHHPNHKDKTDGHRNRMAQRYMVKRFLVDLWEAWRKMEGLPCEKGEYAHGVLGHKHGVAA